MAISYSPIYVELWIDQVIQHKIDGCRAVVTNWDEIAPWVKQYFDGHLVIIERAICK